MSIIVGFILYFSSDFFLAFNFFILIEPCEYLLQVGAFNFSIKRSASILFIYKAIGNVSHALMNKHMQTIFKNFPFELEGGQMGRR